MSKTRSGALKANLNGELQVEIALRHAGGGGGSHRPSCKLATSEITLSLTMTEEDFFNSLIIAEAAEQMVVVKNKSENSNDEPKRHFYTFSPG